MVVQEFCPIFVCSLSGHWKSQVSFSELKWGSYVIIFCVKFDIHVKVILERLLKMSKPPWKWWPSGDAGCYDVRNGYFATLLKELVALEMSKYFWDWLRKQYHLTSFNWPCFMLVQCIYGCSFVFYIIPADSNYSWKVSSKQYWWGEEAWVLNTDCKWWMLQINPKFFCNIGSPS